MEQGSEVCYLRRRHGFIRMALRHGAGMPADVSIRHAALWCSPGQCTSKQPVMTISCAGCRSCACVRLRTEVRRSSNVEGAMTPHDLSHLLLCHASMWRIGSRNYV